MKLESFFRNSFSIAASCAFMTVQILVGQNQDGIGGDVKRDRFLPLSIMPFIDGGNQEKTEMITKDGIPFSVIDNGKTVLSLSEAGWPEQKEDPAEYYENYDHAAKNVASTRLPLIPIPREDYVAAYALCLADPNPETCNILTLRAGPRVGVAGKESETWMKDFMVTVPRSSGQEPAFAVVRIPFTEAFSQDVRGKEMFLELTKELRLAVHAPDACRFRWRPLGIPSGVKVAAVTLERSPLQMEVHPASFGGLFEQPDQPAYRAKLTNVTDKDQEFTLTFAPENGRATTAKGVVPAGKAVEEYVVLPDSALGYHSLRITLANNGIPLFCRSSAFGVLAKNERKHHEASPLGTWTFNGSHGTSVDDENVGHLYQQLGLRYGMFGATAELRAKYGVLQGLEVATAKTPEQTVKNYEAYMARHSDLAEHLLVFHENVISGAHATRVPDLFVDRSPYVLSEDERKTFSGMTHLAVETTKLFREKYPNVKIHLGNGLPTLREEFYRNKFPSELFDAAGNEAGSFMRPPESQPPDAVANNASLWMDRQMLDAYGYEDKAISQCLEITYPCTNPGNLSLQTQADYFIRNILHSMSWGIRQIRVGILMDTANSYSYGNWGGSGFFTRFPTVAPKPSALAIATLTRVLDGASFEKFIETGSNSTYLLQFKKTDDSRVLVYWVVRGERDLALSLEGAREVTRVLRDGATETLAIRDNKTKVAATSSPAYLELPAGASLKSIDLGKARYSDKLEGKVSQLSALASLDGWKLEDKRNAKLEFYNPMEPRRLGKFGIEPVKEFEGRGPVLCVTPQPVRGGKPTMPMYAELSSENGILLSGKPTQIGMWVNGNSSWGRIIYELEDASGQKWISIGAKAAENSRWMADWLSPELLKQFKPGDQADWNTDDVFGFSRINFDGWKFVSCPLPGQYPGEGHHWPFNSQWSSDKDGVVHYPLKLKKIIVQLPEKTLYLSRFESVRRRSIYLSDLVSVEREDPYPVKTAPGEYVEPAQVLMN